MKKLYILPLLFLFIFVGCGEDTLSLKEKCNQYLPASTERVEKLNNESYIISYSHNGIFYSREKDSCISIVKEFSSFEERTTFRDELAGTDLVSYPVENFLTPEQKESSRSLIDIFIKKLDLVR